MAGFHSIAAFTKGSSLSSQIPFDILLGFDKNKSPGCPPPYCFSFLPLLCFCVLTHEPKLARGWWDLGGRGQQGSQGGMGGSQEAFSRPASISGSLRSEQSDQALDSASLSCSFLLSLKKIHIYKRIISFI